MPSVFIPLPVPIVPLAPGVPPLPAFLPGVPTPPASALPAPVRAVTADSPTALSAVGRNQWGIFGPNGAVILTVDSVASVEYARDYRISDYPQEQGAFESYNKVQTPFQGKVSFLIGPSRRIFLNEIEAQLKSLQFVSLVTPEITYPSANLTHYGFRRQARHGVTLLIVDVWCEEVRVIGSAQLSNTKEPASAPTQENGNVQPVDTETPTVPSATPAPTNPPTIISPSGATSTPDVTPSTFVAPGSLELPNAVDNLTLPQTNAIITNVPLGSDVKIFPLDSGNTLIYPQ